MPSLRRQSGRKNTRPRRTRAAFRPSAEALEDRLAPAITAPVSLTVFDGPDDADSRSLPWAISGGYSCHYIDENGDSHDEGASGISLDANGDPVLAVSDNPQSCNVRGTFQVPPGYQLVYHAADGVNTFLGVQVDGRSFLDLTFSGADPRGGSGVYYLPVTISGTVFEDLNGNGARDGGEPPLANTEVLLSNHDALFINVRTDADGLVTYSSAPGRYNLTVQGLHVPGNGPLWYQTSPAVPDRDHALAGGQSAVGVEVGLFRPVTVAGVVFDDLNQDGRRDAATEALLPGVTVTLTPVDGPAAANGDAPITAVTDEFGVYNILDVGAGTYRLRQTLLGPDSVETTDPQGFLVVVAASGQAVLPPDMGQTAASCGAGGAVADRAAPAAGQCHGPITVNVVGDQAILPAMLLKPPSERHCDSDPKPKDQCTLRAAIQLVNSLGLPQSIIKFKIPAGRVITLHEELPAVTVPVLIDGTTQLEVQVNGARATVGLQIEAGGSTVKGLELTGFQGDAIVLRGGGQNLIELNKIHDNAGNGVKVESGFGNTVRDNSISANGAKALAVAGTTEFTAFFEWPRLPEPGQEGVFYRAGVFHGTPGLDYTIDFYSNPDADPSGYGEGKKYLGALAAVRVHVGPEGRSAPFRVPDGDNVTAAATDVLTGTTYEFSNCVGPGWTEAVQVVQDRSNSVPMVADKHTLIRVFPNAEGDATFDSDTSGRLYGFRDGKPLSGGPLLPVGAVPGRTMFVERGKVADRNSQLSSLNFVLPDDWVRAGTIVLRAETFPTRSAGVPRRVLYQEVTFHEVPPLTVHYLPVCYKGAFGKVCPPSDVMSTLYQTMESVYPVPNNGGIKFPRVEEEPILMEDGFVTPFFLYTYAAERYWQALHGAIPRNEFLVLLFPGSVDDFNKHGVSYRNGGISYVVLTAKPYDPQWTLAHEVGHLLGRHHTNLPQGGFDPATDWPYPNNFIQDPGVEFNPDGSYNSNSFHKSGETNEFMSYALQYWASAFTYKNLFDSLSPAAAGGEPTSPRAAFGPAAAPGNSYAYALVTGAVGPDPGNGRFDTAFQISSSVSAPPVPSDPEGDYCLEFRDADGNALSQHCFSVPAQLDGEPPPDSPQELPFAVAAAYPAGTARLVLLHDGTELASLIASPNAPTVTITSPQAGDAWQGTQTVTWDASDADGNPLAYAVEYSADGGATWLPLATSLHETHLDVDTSYLAGGTDVHFRVLASDGLHTTAAEVGPLTVTVLDTTPPVLHVVPSDLVVETTDPTGAIVTYRPPTATDDLDPNPAVACNVPSGSRFPRGTTTVTCTATDQAGNTDTATFTVTVQVPQGPRVTDLTTVSTSAGVSSIVVHFSEPLDIAAAVQAKNYELRLPGRDRRTGTHDDVVLRLADPVYDDADWTVTLTPVKARKPTIPQPLPLNTLFGVTVRSAVTDVAGNGLDGNADGTAGDDYHGGLGRGKTLKYTDADGDKVKLALKGGILELVTAADGDGQTLRLFDQTPSSRLTGRVTKPRNGGDGLTTLDAILPADGFVNALPTSFLVPQAAGAAAWAHDLLFAQLGTKAVQAPVPRLLD